MSRLAAVLLNTVNAITFLVVLVGLPVALVSIVGWPGPTAVPDISKIESVVTGREQVPPLFLIKSLTIVAWLIWVQLVLAMIEEIKAVRLDLVAKKSFVLPGIQKFVASAVLAITLLINGLKPASAAPVAAPAPIAQPFQAEQANPPPAQRVEATEAVETKTYLTQAGDSWWEVAERFLGDGSRFGELRQLNVGKSFDGLVIQEESDYLGVGWSIELPSDAKASTTITVKSGDTLSELEQDHALEEGDLAEINKIGSPDLIYPGQKLEVPNPITESLLLDDAQHAESSTGDSAPRTSESAEPTTVSPTEESKPAEVKPVLRSGNPIGSGQQATAPIQTQEPATEQNESGLQADENTDINSRLAIGGLLTALAFLAPTLWSVRRRRFRASLRTVTTDQPEVVELNETETAKMAAAASYGDDAFIAVILQLVGQRMSSSRQDPGLLAITVDGDAAHLLFEDTPTFEPGPGFVAAGKKWTAERPVSLTQMRSRASISIVPCPAMVTLGSVSGSSIAVNLEQLGGLNIVGSQSEIREVMFNIAVELASSDLAETIRIVVVGFNMNLPGLDRVEQYDTLPSELSNTQKVDNPGLQRLLTVDLASSQPVIVISPDGSLAADSVGDGVISVLASKDKSDLADLIVHGSLVSLPRLGFNNVERIRLSPREICNYLEPLRTTRPEVSKSVQQQPRQVGQQQTTEAVPNLLPVEPEPALRQVSDLAIEEKEAGTTDLAASVSIAARITGPVGLRPVERPSQEAEQKSTSKEPPVDPLPNASKIMDLEKIETQHNTNRQNENEEKFDPVSPLDLGFTFVVSVLGPIKLDGVNLADSEKTWRYTKTAELIVLLATSDVPRTGDALKELLWPARDPIKCGPALANATSDARTRVVGEQRFPKLAPGATLYKVDGIGTDLDLFEENLDRAKASASTEVEMAYRRAALDLVEGLPFDTFAHKSGGYGWADTLMMSATVQIVNVAVELSRWEFDEGQYRSAAEAAEKGLRAAPENYELLNLFGKACLAASDHDQARQALVKIMDIENEYVEGTPGVSEPELPEDLRQTQAALEKYLRYDSA